jgi:hypothetical protein
MPPRVLPLFIGGESARRHYRWRVGAYADPCASLLEFRRVFTFKVARRGEHYGCNRCLAHEQSDPFNLHGGVAEWTVDAAGSRAVDAWLGEL